MGSGERNPKLFPVSSTTTTLSTTTLCYISSGTPSTAAACGKRKRRALVIDSLTEGGEIAVTKAGESGALESAYNAEAEVADSQKDAKEDYQREGKFLLYWMTTTSTSTSYTATTTISSLACTPSGFTISIC